MSYSCCFSRRQWCHYTVWPVSLTSQHVCKHDRPAPHKREWKINAELQGVKLWQISHEPNPTRKHPARCALISHFSAFSRSMLRCIRWMCLISHPPPLTPYTLVQHGDVRLPSNIYSESSATFQWDFPHTCETQELKKNQQKKQCRCQQLQNMSNLFTFSSSEGM